jgi:hypothetical protein
MSADDFLSGKKVCEDVVGAGVLSALSAQTPEELGLLMQRRHGCWELLQ